MLASPIIEGTLPAFYANEDGTATLAVPFSMSRAVSVAEVSKFRLKIKDIQRSDYKDLLISDSIDYTKSMVYFTISADKLKNYLVGTFYKAQLAYVDNKGETGYYSTVGVIKYTTKPNISILGLQRYISNAHGYTYTGIYSQFKKDTTEKEYSYRFILKDELDNIVEDTGDIIHNSSNNENSYESQDIFYLNKDLEIDKRYTLTYSVKTNNGLEVKSYPYKITQKKFILPMLEARLYTSLDHENGYVNIWLKGNKDQFGDEIKGRGNFVISRSSEKSNFMKWETIEKFSLKSQKPSSKQFKDFSVEQGVRYRYCVQQYNDTLYSDRLLSRTENGKEEPIYVDFEYSFLFDGERQLKIKFNPKVSSFKKDIFEAKVDTLGSKYPFIFRNGQVEYKEFPISGLISYLMDEQGLFMNNRDLFKEVHREYKNVYKKVEINFNSPEKVLEKQYLEEYEDYLLYDNKEYIKWTDYLENDLGLDSTEWHPIYISGIFRKYSDRLYFLTKQKVDNFNFEKERIASVNLDSQNISLEREFKLEVLNWLTNGKPKLFKSPNEGNYIVRLLNVSLTPEDGLGRMIHTFNATAYEVAEMNYDSMVEFDIIKNEVNNNTYLKITQIPMATKDENYVNLNKGNIDYIFDERSGYYFASGQLLPNGVVAERLSLKDFTPGTEIIINGTSIVIGSTGTYNAPIQATSIILPNNQKSYGSLEFSYITEVKSSFNQVVGTDIKEVYGKQMIGSYNNIIEELENIEKKIIAFHNIKLLKRPQQKINKADIINIDLNNKLYTYTYSDLGDLYSPIYFVNTDGRNNKDLEKITDITKPENRTSTNPYIADIRDFDLYKQAKKLYKFENNEFVLVVDGNLEQSFDIPVNGESIYYIQDVIDYVYVPEKPDQIFITEECYKKFEKMPIDLLEKYTPYLVGAKINNEEIYLNEIDYYALKNIGSIEKLQTYDGIYIELFYQQQVINYNVSQNYNLSLLQQQIQDYNYKMSKEYVIQQCIENNNEEEYIRTINDVLLNYSDVYNNYILELTKYLNKLNEEG